MDPNKRELRKRARVRKVWKWIFLLSLIPTVMSMRWMGSCACLFFCFLSFMAYAAYYLLRPPKDEGSWPWWGGL